MATNSDGNVDKSQRSVFVGNIPYEATEEKLKEIFSEVGPVNSFKLVYDRENGKPKGYGFCEYKDAETALSAMRNLNGYEIGGRTLRVDNACTEKSRIEMQAIVSGQAAAAAAAAALESPYGQPVEPEQAPETISKAVASLPPENMFELMRQMKMCIQNNPQEARMMLNQNPQLAYALLQAQVVMRIVDPELAVTMLHKAQPRPPAFHQQMGPSGRSAAPNLPMDVGAQGFNPMGGVNPIMPPPIMGNEGPPSHAPFGGGSQMAMAGPSSSVGGGAYGREVDPSPSMREERFAGPPATRDPRSRDPRGYDRPRQQPAPVRQSLPPGLPPHLAGAEPDKAQLIMQVLKLTDEQIALLPADQRDSIMQLKKQINAVPQ